MRLFPITLGCQMSAADGSEMSDALRARGWGKAQKLEEADAVLLSTCTVRQHAEDKALSQIGRLAPWKASDPQRVLIVAGCMAERLKESLQARFPHIDLVVGAKSIESFPALVETALESRFDAQAEDRAAFPPRPADDTPTPSTSAFVTIMRGCNYSCAYCIVPSVRGRELYRPISEILADVRRKVEEGASEVMLLGQTVNSYDQTHAGRRIRFGGLLRLVDKTPGLKRLRFMSPHPHYLDLDMTLAMAECETVCEFLHLPAQSGSDRILKLMRRNYTAAEFLRRLEALSKRVDGLVVSTDIIVGFPTETEADFAQSLSLLETMGAASAYCFKFSPRESTEAASLPDDVAPEAKEERLRALIAQVERLSLKAARSQIGRKLEILTEDAGFGRTRTNFKVRMTSQPLPPRGRLLAAAITGTRGRTLLGKEVEATNDR